MARRPAKKKEKRMDTFNQKFTGVGVALITPFRNDESIDFAALGWLIDQMIDGGVDFLVPCGTTGESATLSHSEHNEVIRFTVEIVGGRVPVVAGTGSNNTTEAVEMTRVAKENGADAALVISPYCNKPMPNGMFDYYRRIAEVGLPVILYDIPGRTAKPVPTWVIKQLAQEGSIIGLKWASGDKNQLIELISELSPEFVALSGDDNLTLDAMELGAKGVISVAAHVFPEKVKEMCDLAISRNFEGARFLHEHLLSIFETLFIETNPQPVKEAMAILYPSLILPVFRSPMVRLESVSRGVLVQVLRDTYGLITH